MTLFCKFVRACYDESSHAHVETKVGHTVPRWPSLARVAVLPGSAAHGRTDGRKPLYTGARPYVPLPCASFSFDYEQKGKLK